MNKREEGAALVVSLVLLTVALLLGLSSVQSSRMEESMTGNQRSMELAYMATETGASKFYSWLRDPGNTWPSSSPASPWDKGYGEDVGDYARYEVGGICWGGHVTTGDPNDCIEDFDASHVTIWMEGYADNDLAVSRLVSRYKKLPSPPTAAAFTCFGETCSDEVGGSSVLTGEDYHLPTEFDCGGGGQGGECRLPEPIDGADGEYDAYYPDVPYEEHPAADDPDCNDGHETDGATYTICGNKYYGVNDEYSLRAFWDDFLDFVEEAGFDESLEGGQNAKTNIGGRDDYDSGSIDQTDAFWSSVSPKFIEVLPDPNPDPDKRKSLKISSHTNTLGVIVVREGATLEYAATGTHEGLIIVEPGAVLDASNGSPTVYGGIVAMESIDGETAELNISGDLEVRYSSAAWKALYQGGKSIRLVAWYEDISL